MKCFFLFVFTLTTSLDVLAQPSAGTSGLLNTPTADMQADGTLLFGGNYLPEAITPEAFSYNTGNYYVNITFLPFLEINYRLTIIQTESTGKYNQQDRSFALRGRLLHERKYIPAIVVGGNDIYTSCKGSNQYFGSFYIVATKKLELSKNKLTTTLGCGIDIFDRNRCSGIFGGLAFYPCFFAPLSLIIEYDTQAFNAGASLLFKHFWVYAFTYNMKYLSGGIAYKIYLKKDDK